MKPFLQLSDLDVRGKTVFCRLDLNVPLNDGQITSEARIKAALPTLRSLIDGGAKLAVASHLGRPKGRRRPEFSLEPVGLKLSEHLSCDVLLAEDCKGDGVRALLRDARPASIVLLENLRYHSEEEANDPAFARALAQDFQVYVNDAFGASHRAHASIVGMVRHVGEAAAGPLVKAEVEALQKLWQSPAKPFVAIVGGAKVADKLGVLQALLGRADVLCIGGAMAYTFLRAQGKHVGKSRVEEDRLRAAGEILSRAKSRGVQVVLPQDHVVAADFAADSPAKHVLEADISGDFMGLDIGKATRDTFAAHIGRAKTLFWNGPMGVFEWQPFAEGTLTVARAVAHCLGYTVVGGGDSVAAVEQAGVVPAIGHVSTGGGAALEFLQHGTLPGLDALREHAKGSLT